MGSTPESRGNLTAADLAGYNESVETQYKELTSLLSSRDETWQRLPEVVGYLCSPDSSLRHLAVKLLVHHGAPDCIYNLPVELLEQPEEFLRWCLEVLFAPWYREQGREHLYREHLRSAVDVLQTFTPAQTELAAWCLLRALLTGLHQPTTTSHLHNEMQRIRTRLYERAHIEADFESISDKELATWIAEQTMTPAERQVAREYTERMTPEPYPEATPSETTLTQKQEEVWDDDVPIAASIDFYVGEDSESLDADRGIEGFDADEEIEAFDDLVFGAASEEPALAEEAEEPILPGAAPPEASTDGVKPRFDAMPFEPEVDEKKTKFDAMPSEPEAALDEVDAEVDTDWMGPEEVATSAREERKADLVPDTVLQERELSQESAPAPAPAPISTTELPSAPAPAEKARKESTGIPQEAEVPEELLPFEEDVRPQRGRVTLPSDDATQEKPTFKGRSRRMPAQDRLEQPESREDESISLGAPQAEYPPAPARAKKSGVGLLTLPFRLIQAILYLPVLLVTALGVGLWKVLSGTYALLKSIGTGIFNLFRDLWANLKQRAEEQGVRPFELLLSDDAGRPGPFERFTAQSVALMKAIQHTIGLRFVLLINAIDAFVEMTVGYIAGIFNTWKMMMTVRRRLKNRHRPAHSLAEDVSLCRVKLSRLFGFVGFYTEEARHLFPQQEEWDMATGETFPLKLVLDTRGKLDDMKRDLAILTMHQTFSNTKKSVRQFFLSWIPNPLNLLTAWKDIFVMFALMRYSRREVEQIYLNLLDRYQQTLVLLQEQALVDSARPTPEQLEVYHQQLLDYENQMYQRLSQQRFAGTWMLEPAIDQNRHNVQRLIQLLCCPILMVEPHRWSRADLVLENRKMEDMVRFHPHYALLLEQWLSKAVAKALKKKGFRPDSQEAQQQLRETQHWRRRKQLLQQIQKRWGHRL